MRAAEIAEALDARRLEVCEYLFPNGKRAGHEYQVGSLAGEAGDSLKIHLNGKGAVWHDFADGDGKGGKDMLELWARARCNGNIGEAMREAVEWLGIDGNGPPARIAPKLRAVAAARPKPSAHAGKIPAAHPTLGKPSASWIYRDEHGEPVAVVMRFETATGKEYRPYDLQTGEWTMSAPRPLYRLDELAKRQGEPVVLLEGEKCADALAGVGVISTSVMGGAQAVGQADLEPLRGRTVYLWRDNDAAGEAWLEKLLGALRDLAGAQFIVPIPEGVPAKWDAADAIAGGWTAEQVLELIEKAERPARKLKALELADFLTIELPERELMLEPWLPTQGLAMLFSKRGVGKTQAALGVAFAIANGGTFLKWKASKPRRVLYIDGEMPARTMQERLRAISRANGGAVPEPGFLRIITPDLQAGGIPDLASIEGQAALEEWLADGVDLVVLDNISTLCRTGAENEAEGWLPMQTLALGLRRRGISVLFVHHAGKGGQQRGTSRREDVLDTIIELRHPPDYIAAQGARFEVRFDKARGFHGQDAEPFEAALEIDEHGAAVWTTQSIEDRITRQVADLTNQGMSVREIVEELGGEIKKSSVNRHQQKAREKGWIS